MNTLAYILALSIAIVACGDSAFAGPQDANDGAAPGSHALRKKNPGDMSYRSAWRMQMKVAALLPKDARLISPSLRLSIDGMDQAARAEFLPEQWGVAIVGKTVDTVVPMRRGGYFVVPSLSQAQSRQEDAIVMFNAQARKSSLDVGWHVNVPASGKLAYRQFGQALQELKLAQESIPWWDIPMADEKRARFDAMRACFSNRDGEILVAGRPAGKKLSEHCSLLAFDAARLGTDPAIAFDGQLDYVALDNSADYPSDFNAPGVRTLSEVSRPVSQQLN